MKLLTDENISPLLIKELRQNEHDVLDIKEKNMRGVSDETIIQLAEKENRIILTHDFDFVNLATKFPRMRVILITFTKKSATREIMKLLGSYIGKNIDQIYKKGEIILIKVDQKTLNLSPLFT